MKVHDIRAMSREELSERVRELRTEVFNLKFRGATEKLDNPVRLRTARRELAAALTVLCEDSAGIHPLAGEKVSRKGK